MPRLKERALLTCGKVNCRSERFVIGDHRQQSSVSWSPAALKNCQKNHADAGHRVQDCPWSTRSTEWRCLPSPFISADSRTGSNYKHKIKRISASSPRLLLASSLPIVVSTKDTPPAPCGRVIHEIEFVDHRPEPEPRCPGPGDADPAARINNTIAWGSLRRLHRHDAGCRPTT